MADEPQSKSNAWRAAASLKKLASQRTLSALARALARAAASAHLKYPKLEDDKNAQRFARQNKRRVSLKRRKKGKREK